MKWIKLNIELPEGNFVKMIKLEGRKLCLVRHERKLHVVQNGCPHAGGILSGGWCKNGNIVCPIHRYEYNLETGKGLAEQGDYIDIYPVEERTDGIYVGFKDSWIKKLFS